MRKWWSLGLEWLIGLAVVAAAAWFYVTAKPPEKSVQRQAAPPPVVEAVRLQPQRQTEVLPANGTVLADESVEITATAAEKILSIHFEDGQTVKQGDLLVQLDNLQELATLKQAGIVCDEAEREAARVTELLGKQVISRKEYDTQLTRLAAARAALELVNANLRDRRIEAPFDGILGRRLVSPGHLVSPGTLITTLDDLSQVKVDFTIPEKYLTRVSSGQPFEAGSAAYPGRTFAGHILVIDPRVEAVTRSVQVRGVIANADLALRPGMLLNVGLRLNDGEVLRLPEKAIQSLGELQYVFVLDEQLIARRRTVALGNRSDGAVAITSGLAGGELVVCEGAGKLSDGMAVVLAPEAQTP